MKKNLVLLGMMGVGKSTLGKIVAKELNLRFFDIDHLIEKKNSLKIKDIFEKKGEVFFRKEEEEISLKFIKKNNSIIALGGGAFINKKIRNFILQNCLSIWIKVPIIKISKRLKINFKRPLLKKHDNLKILKKLYEERKEIYKLANYELDCDKLSINAIKNNIIKLYEINKNNN